jgi:phenylalanyl-tRNA synthetase alpha chain
MPGTRGPVPVPLETQNRNLTQDVLDLLDTKETLQTNEDFPTIPQAEIKAALDRLASRSMVEYKSTNSDKVTLTQESETIVEQGSHEFRVWKAIKDAGKVSIKELPVRTFENRIRRKTDSGIERRWRTIRECRRWKWVQEQVDQEGR